MIWFTLRLSLGNKMSETVKRGIAQTCNLFLSKREISFACVGCFEQIIWESHDKITGIK